MLAFDIFCGNVKDDFLCKKFIRAVPVLELRCNRMLEDRFCGLADYLMNQPVSRLISIINKFADVFSNTRNRGEIKTAIVKQWTKEYKEEEAL